MSDQIRVFINGQPVTLESGMMIRDAVAGFDPELAAALGSGAAYVTDGVGRRIDPEARLEPGSIIRVVRSARRRSGSVGS